MKKIILIFLLILSVSRNGAKADEQMQFTDADSVISYLVGEWVLVGACDTLFGAECLDPIDDGVPLSYVFSEIDGSNDSIFLAIYFNDELFTSLNLTLSYSASIYGENWNLVNKDTLSDWNASLFFISNDTLRLGNNLNDGFIATFVRPNPLFPKPGYFGFGYTYIMLGQSDFCEPGKTVYGPAYCSYFEWTTPDTSSLSAQLDHYNLYYHDSHGDTTTLLASLKDTSCYIVIGIMGNVWVTAVYTNPTGESMISRMIQNSDLPIAVEELRHATKPTLFYDDTSQSIFLENNHNPSLVRIFDKYGRLVKKVSNSDVIDVSGLRHGLYIIVVQVGETIVLRQKIVK
jgi:hypothetical protein